MYKYMSTHHSVKDVDVKSSSIVRFCVFCVCLSYFLVIINIEQQVSVKIDVDISPNFRSSTFFFMINTEYRPYNLHGIQMYIFYCRLE